MKGISDRIKRILAVALSVFVVAAYFPMPAYADETHEHIICEDGHSYIANVTPPTCTEQGYTTFICTVCGDSYVGDQVPVTEHSHNVTDHKDPTCTESGYVTYSCECGHSHTETMAAAGHSYSAFLTEPTCQSSGYTVYTCSGCGDTYISDFTEPSAHQWDNGVVTQEPTEEVSGVMTYTCTVCGTTKTENVPYGDDNKNDGTGENSDSEEGVDGDGQEGSEEEQPVSDEVVDPEITEDEVVEDPSEEIVEEPTEEVLEEIVETELLDEVKADIDAILAEYGIEIGDDENTIYRKVFIDYSANGGTQNPYELIAALEYKIKGLSEEEKEMLEAYSNTKTFVDFYNVLIMSYETMVIAANGTYEPVTSLTVNVSGATDNSMSNGNLTVTAKGSGGLFGIGASAKTSQITLTNNSGSTATVSFDWTAESMNKLVIDGATKTGASGNFSKMMNAGDTVTITITTAKNGTVNKLVMKNFGLIVAKETSNVTFNYDSSLGNISVAGTEVDSGHVAEGVSLTNGVAIAAVPTDGKVFVGWKNAETNGLISASANYTLIPTSDITVEAVFANLGEAWWLNTTTKYMSNDLNSIAAAGGTVALMTNATLPAGEYVIPNGTKLLIPFDNANTYYGAETGTNKMEIMGIFNVDVTIPKEPEAVTDKYTKPSIYRTLTLANGANITVNGEMSLSAKFSTATGGDTFAGSPTNAVSVVKMNKNSKITVENGGKLFAWGYITGNGSVEAKSGANVYEFFQFTDFRGGTQSTTMKNGVFPLSQYYVQNIEVPLTINTGATEYALTGFNMQSTDIASLLPFIAPKGAMFSLNKGTVTKWYDGAADRLMVETDGVVEVSGIKMTIGATSIDSTDYVLPITSNITMVARNGTNITLGQDVSFLPGSNITIEKGATCALGSGVNVYIYDSEQWSNYCGAKDKTFIPLEYAPGRTYTRNDANLVDAVILVEGVLDASLGNLYTTNSGANICGTKDGRVILKSSTNSGTTYQYRQTSDAYDAISVTRAMLKNGDGKYVTTASNLSVTEYTYNEYGKWDYNHPHTPQDGTVVETPATCLVSATKTYTCSICGETVIEETASALGHDYPDEWKRESDPTCSEKGFEYRICNVCKEIGENGTREIPALGHDWTEWESNGADKHTRECERGCGEIETGDCSGGTKTCEEQAVCETCHSSYGGVLGHDYNAAEYGWTQNIDGSWDCTAKRICQNDTNHNETALATVTEEQTKDPTCTEKGETTYTAVFDVDWAEEQTKTIENVDILKHNYGAPEYVWTQKPDGSWTCTATRICQNDAEHKETADAEVSAEQTLDPTCTEKGKTTYTAVFDVDWAVTQTQIESDIASNGHTLIHTEAKPATCLENGNHEYWTCSVCREVFADKEATVTTNVSDRIINSPGHDYGAVSINWADNGLTCTASRECSVCEEGVYGHVQSVTVTAEYVVTKEATCTAKGDTTYTVEFTAEWIPEEDRESEKLITGNVDIDPDNHSSSEYIYEKIDGSTHYKKYACCNAVVTTEQHTYINGVCDCDAVQMLNITWINGNSTKFTTVEYGNVPVSPFDVSELVKDAVKEHHYIFVGWAAAEAGDTTELEAVTGSATYYAVFEEEAHSTDEENEDPSKRHDCQICGYDDVTPHDYSLSTCTEPATCKICGAIGDPAKGHEFTHNTERSYWTYNEETGVCTYTAVATCIQEGSCYEIESETVTAVIQAEGLVPAECTKTGKATYIASGFVKIWAADLELSYIGVIPALGHDLTETPAKDPTCTVEGNKSYWTCGTCGKVYEDQEASKPTTVEAMKLTIVPHDWDGGEITIPAGCETSGVRTYTCGVCGGIKEETISSTGHDYENGNIAYEWSTDNTSCKATRTCANGCSKDEIAQAAAITSSISIPAQCESDGVRTYKAVFGVAWAEEQTKPAVIAALSHNYTNSKIDFIWNNDKTECTAKHYCQRSGCSHVESETVSDITPVIIDATCTNTGTKTYTAVFTSDWIPEQDRTQTEVETISSKGHSYGGEVTYSWTQGIDGKWNCSASRNCTVCDENTTGYTYTVYADAITSEVYRDSDCGTGTAGDTKYIATFKEDWALGSENIVEGDIPADHNWLPTNEVPATCLTAGHTAGSVCSDCGTVQGEAVISPLGHDWTVWTSNGDNTHSRSCNRCDIEPETGICSGGSATCEDKAICETCNSPYGDALNHDYGNTEYTWTFKNGSWTCLAERTCKNDPQHHDAVEGEISSAVKVNADCTNYGTTEYTAVFEGVSWAETQTNPVDDIPETGHSFTAESAEEDYLKSAATCITSAIYFISCSVCGASSENTDDETTFVVGDPLNHEWTAWSTNNNGTHTRFCERDGCTVVFETGNCSGGTATCEEPAECGICGSYYGKELGHRYSDDIDYPWTYDEENETWKCTAIRVCENDPQHIETANATVSSSESIPATCLTMGTTTYVASFTEDWAIQQVKNEVDIDFAPCTPDSGIITKSPFYNTAGERTFYCTLCGEECGTEEIPETGVINISVLGDSITAFKNYSNGTAATTANTTLAGGRVWFPMTGKDSEGNEAAEIVGEIQEAEQIWIYKAAEELGANVLVNNSWSGSAVQFWQYGAPGMWLDRCVQLHDNVGDNNGQEPDIIAVYMGTNDFKHVEGVHGMPPIGEDKKELDITVDTLGTFKDVDFDTLIIDNGDGTFTYEEPLTTMEAYAVSFHKMKQRYPNSEIYVLTLLPFKENKEQPTDFNEDIRQMVKHFGVVLVDIEDAGIESDAKSYEYLMEDWLHPNIKGMEVISNAFVSEIREHSSLINDNYVNVTYELEGVTSMEGTSRTALVGQSFVSNVKLKDSGLTMNVTVTMNGQDITESCYSEIDDEKLGGKLGVISISNVTGTINITAKSHTHSYSAQITPPTCLDGGYTTYTCECGDSYVENETAASGHSFTIKASNVKAEDATCNLAAQYFVQCDNCTEVSDSLKVYVGNSLGHEYTTLASDNKATDATCIKPATYYVQCNRCDSVHGSMTVNVGEANGHTYGETGYNWSEDGRSCTAYHICMVTGCGENDPGHTETATAAISSNVTQEPTCVVKGKTTYTATFDVDWASGQTKTVEDIPANDHTYGETVYTWSEDGKSCTASRSCIVAGCSKSDAGHTQTARAEITGVQTNAPDCTVMGDTTYTATFNVDWATDQTKTVTDIQANGHTYGETVYTWSEDGKTCTATHICIVDGCSDSTEGHKETSTASISSRQTASPTCNAFGETTYTAIFAENWASRQTKVVADVAMARHNYGQIEYEWTQKEDGDWSCVANNTCDKCTAVETSSATVSVVIIPADCTDDGKAVYTAEFDDDWAATKIKEVKLDKIGHDYANSEISYIWSLDETNGQWSCIATRICQRDGCGIEESATAEIYSRKISDATCIEMGETEYTAVFYTDWVREKRHTKVVADIDFAEHTVVIDLARESTCYSTGLTEGSHCRVCGDVLVEQFPTEMKEHTLIHFEGRKPTYTDVGYEAYDTCEYCSYTTYTSTPALGEPIISTYEEFIENLPYLEYLAEEYSYVNPGKDPIDLVIKYIRTGVERYNSGSWGIMAGYEDAGFAEYVSEMENAANSEIDNIEDYYKISGLKNLEEFYLPNGEKVDFGHMFGTMDISYNNKGSVNHADVGGWAGDLVDLMTASDRAYNNSPDSTVSFEVPDDVEVMVEQIGTEIFLKTTCEDDKFSESDFSGDIDGLYVIQKLYQKEYQAGDMTDIITGWCTASLNNTKRAEFFVQNRLGGSGTRDQMREMIYDEFVSNKTIVTLEGTREFLNSDPEYLEMLRQASCYAFSDYICKLAGDYVVVDSNPYFTTFSSELSTLAPGITQDIRMATTADNKQIVYYIATADLNNPNVNVQANYGDAYVSDWRMERVLDQANYAQKKYSDPESKYYIPNYQVIVATNGDGFNMSTGEPGGLLVMDGVEYYPVDGDGFFGITKDGKAVIGTMQEYNTIYKGDLQDGIGRFGSTLVKDGKLAISATGNYYTDRASRTAVGITKTGKVVMMVLDGRQEPWSCGGSMEEIAQIMLEAGCVEAVNLDGGGSTTFVSKPEGSDKLVVTNRPSDGYARSVAATLMMVSTAPSSTAFDHAVLESDHNYVTVNSEIAITARGVSATGNEADLPEGYIWSVSDESKGRITQEGRFTGTGLGDVDVIISCDGEELGSTTVHVVEPTHLYFVKPNVNAIYGSTIDMPIAALYNGKNVVINENDVEFTVSPDGVGECNGFRFTVAEESIYKVATVVAKLAANDDITASLTVNLYNQGEATFDFDQATAGNRQLAWLREVSNTVTDDDQTYTVVDDTIPTEVSYIFAMDMTQITIPEELNDLTYMLPGADATDASAWNFLLQLAERVSVLTEVRTVVSIDKRFDIDYSNMKVVAEYFEVNEELTDYDEETGKLTLVLNWIDQTQPIDPATANPLCMVSGIKMTPKEGVFDNTDNIIFKNTADITYKIYLRANALYSFSQKLESQEKYGLYPFVNPNDENEKGGYMSNEYVSIDDQFAISYASIINGWIREGSGYAYYVEGTKLTGVKNVEGYYYDFGEDGINKGKTKYTGLFTDDEGLNHCVRLGELVKNEFYTVNEVTYHCNDLGVAHDTTSEGDVTCVRGGRMYYTCPTCEITERVGSYVMPKGHTWDENHICTVCGHKGININDGTIGFGTLEDPIPANSVPKYYFSPKGSYPYTYVTFDGKTELTWSADATLNDDGTMRDLFMGWTNLKGIGRAYVHFEGKGDYYGTCTLEYLIVPRSVTNLRVDEIITEDTDSEAEDPVSEANASAVVSWDKADGVDYYRVYFYKNGNRELIGETRNTTYTVTGLDISGNNIYSIQVGGSAISTDGENVVYNSPYWSNTVSIPEGYSPGGSSGGGGGGFVGTDDDTGVEGDPVPGDGTCEGGKNCMSFPFWDVVVTEWYHDPIDYVVAKGLMDGVGNGKFDPNGQTTRAMIWTILARMSGVDTTPSEGEEWYAKALQWAMENGISDGTSPNAYVSREQLATMLWRYAGEKESNHSLSHFADDYRVSDWAKMGLKWAYENGIVNGMGDNMLQPSGNATRAQIAAMIMRYYS